MQVWLYKLTTRKLSSLPSSWSASGNFIDSVKQYFQEYNKTSIKEWTFQNIGKREHDFSWITFNDIMSFTL